VPAARATIVPAARATILPAARAITGGSDRNRRIVIAQSLYAFGALTAIVDTRLSIAIIIVMQLIYALAPRLPLL
jgi:hypothetical protein